MNEVKEAKKEALDALKKFVDTPDDLVTLKMAAQAIKQLTELILQKD